MCLGTNVFEHKRVWAQTCVGTNVSGPKPFGTQKCMPIIQIYVPVMVYALARHSHGHEFLDILRRYMYR